MRHGQLVRPHLIAYTNGSFHYTSVLNEGRAVKLFSPVW